MIRKGIISVRALAIASVLLVLPIATPAAASIACPGLVTNIAIEPDSAIWVSYGHGMHRLCYLNSNHSVNVGTQWKTITPETCKSFYSSFTTAKATGREVRAVYERGDCNVGNWVDPNPYPRCRVASSRIHKRQMVIHRSLAGLQTFSMSLQFRSGCSVVH